MRWLIITSFRLYENVVQGDYDYKVTDNQFLIFELDFLSRQFALIPYWAKCFNIIMSVCIRISAPCRRRRRDVGADRGRRSTLFQNGFEHISPNMSASLPVCVSFVAFASNLDLRTKNIVSVKISLLVLSNRIGLRGIFKNATACECLGRFAR